MARNGYIVMHVLKHPKLTLYFKLIHQFILSSKRYGINFILSHFPLPIQYGGMHINAVSQPLKINEYMNILALRLVLVSRRLLRE